MRNRSSWTFCVVVAGLLSSSRMQACLRIVTKRARSRRATMARDMPGGLVGHQGRREVAGGRWG